MNRNEDRPLTHLTKCGRLKKWAKKGPGRPRLYTEDELWRKTHKRPRYKSQKRKGYIEYPTSAKRRNSQIHLKEPFKHWKETGELYYNITCVADILGISVARLKRLTERRVVPIMDATKGYTSSQVGLIIFSFSILSDDKARAKFLNANWNKPFMEALHGEEAKIKNS
jgi:hypothetical protein